MYVREYMKGPVITVTSKTLIHEAQKIMQEHDVRRLPVVDKGKLVGLVTQDRIREASPSIAASRGIWELNYLLAKMRVDYIMVTDVVTITPDTTVEEACVLGQEHSIGTFPVVNAKGRLIGIVTTTDLYRQMTRMLGFDEKGVRLCIRNCTVDTVQRPIMDILCKHDTDILSMFPVTPVGTRYKDFVIHIATEDAKPIADDIRRLGCEVEIREH